MPACGPKWILTQGHETHRHTTLTISCLVDPASHCQVALHKFSRAVKCASVITVIQFGAELREPCTLEAPVDASFVMLRQAFFGDDLRFQSSSSFKVPHVQIWVRHSQIRPVCSDTHRLHPQPTLARVVMIAFTSVSGGTSSLHCEYCIVLSCLAPHRHSC
jgi:hypothetical protein